MKEENLTFIKSIRSIAKAKPRLVFEQVSNKGTTYYIFTTEGDETHGSYYGISKRELVEVEKIISSENLIPRVFRSDDSGILKLITDNLDKARLPNIRDYKNSTKSLRFRNVCYVLCAQEKLSCSEGENGSVEFCKINQNKFKKTSNTYLSTPVSASQSSKTRKISREEIISLLVDAAQKAPSRKGSDWLCLGVVISHLRETLKKQNLDFEFKGDCKPKKLVEQSDKFEVNQEQKGLMIRLKKKEGID